jgi:hypothetical protein
VTSHLLGSRRGLGRQLGWHPVDLRDERITQGSLCSRGIRKLVARQPAAEERAVQPLPSRDSTTHVCRVFAGLRAKPQGEMFERREIACLFFRQRLIA